MEVKAVSVDMGALREEVPEVSAGNLATLTLAGKASAGQSLVDLKQGAGMMPFEAITYFSAPVVTVAVEPKNPEDLEALQNALEKLVAEDPNLKASVDKDTGEYLLSGMASCI